MEEKQETVRGRSLSAYERADLLFDFAVAYADNANLTRSFGGEGEYSPTEVHMIARIAENPDITVTELARRSNRTKGAVSQVVKRLEEKGLVEKRKAEVNCSRTLLRATEAGLRLNQYHLEHYRKRIEVLESALEARAGREALDQFYDVLAHLYELMKIRRQQLLREKCLECRSRCSEDGEVPPPEQQGERENV